MRLLNVVLQQTGKQVHEHPLRSAFSSGAAIQTIRISRQPLAAIGQKRPVLDHDLKGSFAQRV